METRATKSQLRQIDRRCAQDLHTVGAVLDAFWHAPAARLACFAAGFLILQFECRAGLVFEGRVTRGGAVAPPSGSRYRRKEFRYAAGVMLVYR